MTGTKRQTACGRAYARPILFVVWACALLLAVGCDVAGTTGTVPTPDPLAPGQYGGQYSGGTATGDTEAGAKFAQWVLDQDPNREYITDAVVRAEQTLGVKVQPTITKADTQRLLMALTEGMARTFPSKSLKVIAFYQSGDKLAEANYDAGTNQVDVQFVQ